MRGNTCVGQSFLSPDHPDNDVRHAVLGLVTEGDGTGSKARVSLNVETLLHLQAEPSGLHLSKKQCG